MLMNQTTQLPKKAETDSVSEEAPPEYRPYLGPYTAPLSSREFTVFYLDGHLAVNVPGEGQPVLNPPDDKGIWTIRDDDNLTLSFDKDDAGRVAAMNLHQHFVIPRGLPVSVPMEKILETEGLEAAVTFFNKFRESIPEGYFLNEKSMNSLGYRLLAADKIEAAIQIFKLNVEVYPESFNVYDSLGEAYMKNGHTELAIQNYEKSVAMNPENVNGKQMLEKLKHE
jgi:hypothetical protein